MSDRYEYEIGGTRIELVRGDITHESTDAIVNAANSGLRGGAGVDGAIHAAGGPSILAACREIGGCPTGDAVATGAGELPCRWVIHAVGPRYGRENGREAELLGSAYRNSLARARELGARSVSFPSLSTGAYGYPLEEAARIALSALADELRTNGLQRVRLVLFTDEALAVFVRAADRLLAEDA